ncbi:cell surface protein [Comamonas denitrificans]|uniref:cell surface protein n=1 Tax=Comamonas denitrificans TaxID=117506 RepID=UPI0036164A58
MKKNVLALSIATMVGGLGLSGAAMAAPATFDVNESGAGIIQIVPYFTAQDGNATVLHVVNTDATNAKAVKVRFRGASNSDDLLDFQVFLSPGDAWTGLASANAEGRLQLVTSDSSCTLPASVRTDGVTLAPLDRLSNRLWDTAEKKHAQTREGYVEILEMATIPAHTKTTGLNQLEALYTAVKHVKKDGKMQAPCTASAFAALDAVTDGLTLAAAVVGPPAVPAVVLGAPTGTLAASWYIMNVAKSTTFSGSATALQLAAGAAVPVYAPQKAQIASTLVTADPLIASGIIDKQDFDVPDLSTPLLAPASVTLAHASTQAANLSAALNRATVGNQFYQDAGLNAATDWVFSMPTRRYLVAANYDAEKYIKGTVLNGVGSTGTAAAGAGNTTNYIVRNAMATLAANNGTLPNKFDADANLTVNTAGQICVQAAGQTFYDREEDSVKDGHVVSPGIAKKLNLCGEVHVATFGAKSPLGASVAQSSFQTDFGAGWGVVDFGTGAGNGVPVLGAAFTAATNPNAAAGMVGNYGITWPHFYSK